MKRGEKTVFISYRRTNLPWALAIYKELNQHGYDVFFDFEGIGSGDFESVILANIKGRAHFLVLLTPSALERCGDPGDWLRREIETALDTPRNIVGIECSRLRALFLILHPLLLRSNICSWRVLCASSILARGTM